MLNKLQFNNLIISNKTSIQKGRTESINRLVHKIRKLKFQLDKQKENDRTKSRFRRATETMNHLKKLKPIAIIKNVLLLKRSPDAIITDGLSTPEETGIALLALNKKIHNLITTFKKTLNISDSTNEWRDELMESSKRGAKKNKTELKKKLRQDGKEQKAIARKRQEWIKENNPGTEVEQDTEQKIIATVGQWKIEPTDEASLAASTTTIIESEESKKLKKKTTIIKKKTIEHTEGVHFALPVKKEKEFEKSTKLRNKRTSDVLFGKHANSSNKHETDNERRSSVELKPVITHVVDPFFITETGDNYLSTAVISYEDETSNINKTKNIKNVDDNRTILQFRGDNRSKSNSWKNNDSLKPREQTSYGKEELHPSWAAKRRKPLITEFQGKKITFNSSGETTNRIVENIKINKSAKTVTADETEKLHPSWIAKQKMKPNITAFQGKKISFANNSDED